MAGSNLIGIVGHVLIRIIQATHLPQNDIGRIEQETQVRPGNEHQRQKQLHVGVIATRLADCKHVRLGLLDHELLESLELFHRSWVDAIQYRGVKADEIA